MQNITITVSEAGTAAARTFAYKILIEGNVVAERTLTPVLTSQVQEMASQYFSLLQGTGKAAAKSYLPILRDGLFHLFLEAGWQDFSAMVQPGARLTVASSIPEVLQLPWELLPLFTVSRAAVKSAASFACPEPRTVRLLPRRRWRRGLCVYFFWQPSLWTMKWKSSRSLRRQRVWI